MLDPTVMVALMSMLVLEGWQARLCPVVCTMHSVKIATGGGVLGFLMQVNEFYESIVGSKDQGMMEKKHSESLA